MRYKVCDKVGYVNIIKDNIFDTARHERESFYDDIRFSDCFIITGKGRSFCSSKLFCSELAKKRPDIRVITTDDPGFPGNNIYEAAPVFEKQHKKISLLVNSSSGETKSPKSVVRHMANYIRDTGTEKFSIDAITSDRNSSIGSIAEKYGYVLKLKGRDGNVRKSNYNKGGIMGDVAELGSLVVQQTFGQMICENAPPERFEVIIGNELPKIGSIVDKFVTSPFYSSLIDQVESRVNVHIGGSGVANENSEMLATRLSHIKHALGEEVHLINVSTTPNPRAKDVALFHSFSGGNKEYAGDTDEEEAPVVGWAEIYGKAGANVFSIVGREKCPLAEASGNSFYIPEENRGNKPRWWYVYAAFAESPIPLSLTERLKERGLKLPPEVLRWFHSTAE